MIIHEITHAVFYVHALRLSGYDRDSWNIVMRYCANHRSMERIASKGMAYLNEATYFRNEQPQRLVNAGFHQSYGLGGGALHFSLDDNALYTASIEALRHPNRYSRQRYVPILSAYSDSHEDEAALDDGPGEHCPRLIATQGPWRGRFFTLMDVSAPMAELWRLARE